ncbi:hypothetical protein [Pseudanabaena sp. UWO310]|uniref:hypothetical protein n=1 Tax=Pseudanabaena sp. UWO310 TaxID=2480795 RepID=UPI00115C20DA|nr:hypothetical protein [Pseudanabaena sp. UWO310]TYQ31013.1 hypothetical protein PseudUWO310_05930 [Pseudanabaena sp. UWO310]
MDNREILLYRLFPKQDHALCCNCHQLPSDRLLKLLIGDRWAVDRKPQSNLTPVVACSTLHLLIVISQKF